MTARSNRSSEARPRGMRTSHTPAAGRAKLWLPSGRDVASEPSSKRFSWLKIAVLTGAVVVGAGVAIGIAVARDSGGGPSAEAAPTDAGTTWPAGTRRAPGFALRDQAGRPLALDSLRGRTVVMAFIDPLCRNHCPLEARVLNDVTRRLPAGAKPAIVAVSVNPWGQAPANLRLDGQKWHLVPEWRWALGDFRRLAQVWRRYAIGVQVRTKTTGGITVHDVDHTEAAYVIDAQGFERALFLWPYRAADVAAAVQRVS
jgi:cytochrome oxidase Cu insertion factor (SCO1/SenC/PrrC family)